MVVLADDMNGHVGSSTVGYDGTHGGIGYGDRNADRFRILEFPDTRSIPVDDVCMVLLKVQLIILLCDEDKAKLRSVKVIPNEECVPKHKLLVMGMQFNTTKRWHKKFEHNVCLEAQGGKDVKNTKAWSSSGSRVEIP